MLFRYCCPLKSLNVLRIIANIQYNTIQYNTMNSLVKLPQLSTYHKMECCRPLGLGHCCLFVVVYLLLS